MSENRSDRATTTSSARARWTLWTIVFVDLIGFGILTPLIPFYALRTGLTPDLITLVVASYSIAQFAAMPVWGHVSDRRGRRPVLLVSMAGHAAAYLLLAVADRWELLLLARVIGGVTSANLVTAYAYVSDVTPPAERAAAMGKISAAFGLGVMIGPALGGLLAGGDTIADANLARPALAAAAMSLAAFAGILLWLPESHRPGEPGRPRASGGLGAGLARIARRPALAGLVSLCFLVITFVAAREAIIALWAHETLGMNARAIGLLLAVAGATVVAVQFFAMKPLTQRFSSLALVRAAIVFYAIGWTGLVLAAGWTHVAIATIIVSVATALFQTNMQALISAGAAADERGVVLGVYQGSSALARFVGQAVAGSMFAFIAPGAPFAIGAAMMIPALALLWWTGRALEREAPAATLAPAE